jgi:hypothetical protein
MSGQPRTTPASPGSYAWIRNNILGLVAIFIALSGSAAAATVVIQRDSKSSAKAKASKKAKAKRGPQGPAGAVGAQGAAGAQGAHGADGTATAYARSSPCPSGACDISGGEKKGVTGVNSPATGIYCITAPGINPYLRAAAVTVDALTTTSPVGNAVAVTDGDPAFDGCASDGSQFEVRTERIPTTGAAAAVPANDVGFTIVIP